MQVVNKWNLKFKRNTVYISTAKKMKRHKSNKVCTRFI